MAKKAASKKTGRRSVKAAKKVPVKGRTVRPKAAARPEVKTVSKAKVEKAKPPAALVPSVIGLRSQHVDFLTYKVEQVRKFYSDVLGFHTEQSEGLNYLTVHVTPNSSIGFMPPHPKMIGDQPPPREATLYFVVEDVEKAFNTLTSRGIAFNGRPQEMPWGHRVVWTTDPEGRTVMLGSESESAKE